MHFLQGIIPARFLVLIAHLNVILVILWSKDEIVRQDLPLFFTELDFEKRNYNLSIGLYMSICLIIVELITFLSGISLFWPFISFLSMAFHSFGSICLSLLIIHRWRCESYWLIFMISNILPIISESFAVIGVFALKK